jgi:hypothetical protein
LGAPGSQRSEKALELSQIADLSDSAHISLEVCLDVTGVPKIDVTPGMCLELRVRLRLGFEIKTALRFAIINGKPSIKSAYLNLPDNKVIANLTYGHAATIWRINMGWTRRKNRNQLGFVLDTERGYWARNEQTADEDDADPMSPKTTRVIPFVEDRKNCLLFQPLTEMDENQMASLQGSLKQAIQTVYQLEDSELAAEPLPGRDERKVILFYEAAEGGAGVLRQLIMDPKAFSIVATQAMELCHFDTSSGQDKGRAPRASEDCEAACYDCLMNYSNQRDHSLLDRKSVRTNPQIPFNFLYQKE